MFEFVSRQCFAIHSRAICRIPLRFGATAIRPFGLLFSDTKLCKIDTEQRSAPKTVMKLSCPLSLFMINFELISCIVNQDMISLQGGSFQMGIDDIDGRNGENPAYSSAVKSFKFDKYPVTNYMFKWVYYFGTLMF